MAEDRKISPKAAAIAVLKKFAELTIKAEQEGKSVLTKAEDLKKDDAPPPPTIPGGKTINESIGSPFGKDEEAASEDKKEFKGHIKLAKFLGHIQGKKSAKGMNQDSGNNTPTQPVDNVGPAKNNLDKGETGHEKGINIMSDPSQKSKVMLGTSKNGSQMPSTSKLDHAEAKEGHKQVLNEMKNVKPKLPK